MHMCIYIHIYIYIIQRRPSRRAPGTWSPAPLAGHPSRPLGINTSIDDILINSFM